MQAAIRSALEQAGDENTTLDQLAEVAAEVRTLRRRRYRRRRRQRLAESLDTAESQLVRGARVAYRFSLHWWPGMCG